MKTRHGLCLCLAALPAFAGLVAVTPAQAALVVQDFAGAVTDAVVGNPLGVAVGDPITGQTIYDLALVPGGGYFEFAIDADPSYQLSFSIGGLNFVATDDGDFGVGFPLLLFQDGQLIGFEYLATFAAGGLTELAFDVVFGLVLVTDDAAGFAELVVGEITDFGVPVPVATPLPPALTLLAGGLAAAAIARRQRRA